MGQEVRSQLEEGVRRNPAVGGRDTVVGLLPQGFKVVQVQTLA